jgi:hypothetical protein
MPIMMLMEWDGVTAAQYDQVRKLVRWEEDVPAGAMFHVAAEGPQGLRVTDVWASAEDFNKFIETRLMAGVAQVGITTQPRVQVLAAHALFAPAYKAV